MYSREALLDLHTRCHQSLEGLIAHCSGFTTEQLNREHEGFGYPTIRLQLHHVLGAERYWLGVLEGKMLVDDDEAAFPTTASLEAFRREVAEATRSFLKAHDDEALNRDRTYTTWGNREQVLTPARVVLRTQTHIFHHQGQVLAMCRLLGAPKAGLDFPIR